MGFDQLDGAPVSGCTRDSLTYCAEACPVCDMCSVCPSRNCPRVTHDRGGNERAVVGDLCWAASVRDRDRATMDVYVHDQPPPTHVSAGVVARNGKPLDQTDAPAGEVHACRECGCLYLVPAEPR